ncbi:hypothetical protein KSC_047370 [Ktedonobacter sp. SOSP1-52]|nr:hypothetical protein KSC_047370 [Ktedonobacter sp. SOSP1-52]
MGGYTVSEVQTWREFLGRIIHDPQEKQRIASLLNISPVTLTRWASGESTPRTQNLRQLLQTLPEHRARFVELLPEEVGKPFRDPDLLEESTENPEIPALFYSRIVNAHCDLPAILRFNAICDLVLQQALKHLDPHRVGLELTVITCMPPGEGGKVRSVREIIGRGTPPWDRELEHHTAFLGAESLAGYVINMGRARVVAERSEGFQFFPIVWGEHEQSAMACPILLGDTIAGCLLGLSTRPKFFLPEPRQALLAAYTELINIAFQPGAYYPLQQVELCQMPPYPLQQSYLTHFRSWVSQLMMRERLRVNEAEQLVWQQIEQKLLQLQMVQRY